MLAKDAARRDALRVLDEHWAPAKFPVDPIAVALSLGIEVYTAELPFETSGYITKTGDRAKAQIVVNRSHAPTRQTFTCAHEIGHFYERLTVPQPPDEEYGFVDYRERHGKYDLHELYADEFAGTLLMPPYKIDELHEMGYTPRQMAAFFEVSTAAVEKRLGRLRLR